MYIGLYARLPLWMLKPNYWLQIKSTLGATLYYHLWIFFSEKATILLDIVLEGE